MRADFMPQYAAGFYLNRQVKDERSWLRYLIDLVIAAFRPETLPPVPPPDATAPTIPTVPPDTSLPREETPAERLHEAALLMLGKDASPLDTAPDDLACADSVSALLREVYPDFPTTVSTARLQERLLKDIRFKPTLEWKPGVIVISATEGPNIGHTGICTEGERVMSNDSKTGKWQNNFSRASWVAYYKTKKGLAVKLFEPV